MQLCHILDLDSIIYIYTVTALTPSQIYTESNNRWGTVRSLKWVTPQRGTQNTDQCQTITGRVSEDAAGRNHHLSVTSVSTHTLTSIKWEGSDLAWVFPYTHTQAGVHVYLLCACCHLCVICVWQAISNAGRWEISLPGAFGERKMERGSDRAGSSQRFLVCVCSTLLVWEFMGMNGCGRQLL